MTHFPALLLSVALLLPACGSSTPREATPPPQAAPNAEQAAPADMTPVAVVPQSIRYDAAEKMVFVEAQLTGEGLATRKTPIYVGVTVVTPEGREIDLMVQTLFPGSFDAPVLFTAGVSEVVQDVLIGAWSQRVEPCEVDRYGCREFGFVLDGSLGSWPQGLYSGAPRVRVLPPIYKVDVVGPAAETAKSAMQAAIAPSLKLFGSTLQVEVNADDGATPQEVVVRYAHPHDETLAKRIAAAVGQAVGAPSATAALLPESTSTLVVELR